ncbi:MAG: DUF4426 domain-containing protein [Gammaproteobacteria bacterium]|nr:DUF4426 domain-containing protein [Gammaproteobacteria bacterium]
MSLAGCEPAGTAAGNAELEVLGATESWIQSGDYVLHFNALKTDQLDPDIASNYNIVRSRNRAMLNVSILRQEPNGAMTAVPGNVTATAVNLTGQLKNLLIREIREGSAIYYIAETPIVSGESLIFTVDAIPESEDEAIRVRFQKQFYVEQ